MQVYHIQNNRHAHKQKFFVYFKEISLLFELVPKQKNKNKKSIYINLWLKKQYFMMYLKTTGKAFSNNRNSN